LAALDIAASQWSTTKTDAARSAGETIGPALAELVGRGADNRAADHRVRDRLGFGLRVNGPSASSPPVPQRARAG
jgi:hypothetical protein